MDRGGNPSRSLLSRRSWRERRANRSGEGAHQPREEAPAGSTRAGNGVRSREPGRAHLPSGSCLLHGREPREGARSLQRLVHVAKGPYRCCQQSRVIGTRPQISPAESGPLSFSQSPRVRAAFQKLRTRSCGSGPRGARHPGPRAPRASPKTLSGWGPRPAAHGRRARHRQTAPRRTARPWGQGCWAQLSPCPLKSEGQPDPCLEASQPRHGTKVPSDKPIPGSQVCLCVCWPIELSPATITTLFPPDRSDFISSHLLPGWRWADE